MHVIRDLVRASLLPPLADEHRGGYVTIGVFDGVHLGHQQLVSGMAQAAHAAGGVAIALAFDPHPAAVLSRATPALLTTIEERAELLAALGLDILVVIPFTQDLARKPAADFVGMLSRRLRMVELWGGPDLALGHRRRGDVPFLRRLGAERGFSVRVVEPAVWEGETVSSSRVRAALRAGDISQTTGCLGRPYRLTGVVVHGDGRGRTIGTPTANLSLSPERMLPADGIYACLAHTERMEIHPAAVNIGTRPTFEGLSFAVEAHLLDFRGDLYEQTLALDFVARLRDEMAFAGVDALTAQMQKDIARVREILG